MTLTQQRLYRRQHIELALPTGLAFPRSMQEICGEFETQIRQGRLDGYLPTPTGFSQLDEWLGGGLQAYNLMLVGGPQNVGKTVWALQVARNVAAGGGAAFLLEYEHDEVHMLHRLVCMESKLAAGPEAGVSIADIREAIVRRGDELAGKPHAQGLQAVLSDYPAARRAWDNIGRYFDRLFVVKGHPMKTTLDVIDTYLEWFREGYGLKTVLLVDYLQKVPWSLERVDMDKGEQVTLVTEGLKNLSLQHGVPIVAVSAMDVEGLKADRARVEDLAGGATTKYEPDAVLMLNPRWRWDEDAVRGQVVFSVEKNRSGPTGVEVEHYLHGPHFAFWPTEGET